MPKDLLSEWFFAAFVVIIALSFFICIFETHGTERTEGQSSSTSKWIYISRRLPKRNSKFINHPLDTKIRALLYEAIHKFGHFDYEIACLVFIQCQERVGLWLPDPKVTWVDISRKGTPLDERTVSTTISSDQIRAVNYCDLTLHIHNHPRMYNLRTTISNEDLESVKDILEQCDEEKIRFFVINNNSYQEYPHDYGL